MFIFNWIYKKLIVIFGNLLYYYITIMSFEVCKSFIVCNPNKPVTILRIYPNNNYDFTGTKVNNRQIVSIQKIDGEFALIKGGWIRTKYLVQDTKSSRPTSNEKIKFWGSNIASKSGNNSSGSNKSLKGSKNASKSSNNASGCSNPSKKGNNTSKSSNNVSGNSNSTPICRIGKVLFQLRSEHGFMPNIFGVPGGQKEAKDSDSGATAVREAKEETGIKIAKQKLQLIGQGKKCQWYSVNKSDTTDTHNAPDAKTECGDMDVAMKSGKYGRLFQDFQVSTSGAPYGHAWFKADVFNNRQIADKYDNFFIGGLAGRVRSMLAHPNGNSQYSVQKANAFVIIWK